jgi:hypothetical protein
MTCRRVAWQKDTKRFGGTSRLHPQAKELVVSYFSTLKREGAGSFTTLVTVYQTAWRHI